MSFLFLPDYRLCLSSAGVYLYAMLVHSYQKSFFQAGSCTLCGSDTEHHCAYKKRTNLYQSESFRIKNKLQFYKQNRLFILQKTRTRYERGALGINSFFYLPSLPSVYFLRHAHFSAFFGCRSKDLDTTANKQIQIKINFLLRVLAVFHLIFVWRFLHSSSLWAY